MKRTTPIPIPDVHLELSSRKGVHRCVIEGRDDAARVALDMIRDADISTSAKQHLRSRVGTVSGISRLASQEAGNIAVFGDVMLRIVCPARAKPRPAAHGVRQMPGETR